MRFCMLIFKRVHYTVAPITRSQWQFYVIKVRKAKVVEVSEI